MSVKLQESPVSLHEKACPNCDSIAVELAFWFANKNVSGLFSDGFSLALEKALNGLDIWTHWEVSGEIHEIVEKHWHEHATSAA